MIARGRGRWAVTAVRTGPRTGQHRTGGIIWFDLLQVAWRRRALTTLSIYCRGTKITAVSTGENLGQ